jgi:hypothetical protein
VLTAALIQVCSMSYSLHTRNTWCPLCCLLFVEHHSCEATCGRDEQQAVSEAWAMHLALGRSVDAGEDAIENDNGRDEGY